MTLVTLLRMISPPFKQGEHVVQAQHEKLKEPLESSSGRAQKARFRQSCCTGKVNLRQLLYWQIQIA